MEIKVFKDISKRDKTHGGLTGSQWLFIIALITTIGLDVVNLIFGFLPVFLFRVIFFPLLGLVAFNALFRPYGHKFSTWIKLNWTYQTTVQVRTYQKEGIEQYSAKNFIKNKKIKEAGPKAPNKGS
ncbi:MULTISPECIES: PrgI family protein [Enterococcus]|uniref:PrgI family protein n=1 Tax=Enterococcus gallinarum TaxID=1353 RepID=A0ABD4HMS2_ENTGA|nr:MULTISPECIES: PrgI family protein [Enterococcus]MBA0948003.1 PrgI family protein [Enterococcus gallinarum]MBA0961504.1 PrgI family protein [Enterococcus gallinarum]MBA0969417.1 PrgI family protein [Enterococcus gallinarum]MBA0972790.1 PrgI family protein [Enterococcus gallinarum]NVI94914.1 PrgI family protein [Enterococcus gallinarum]